MGIKNNVFGLEQVYRLQVEGDWTDKSEVFMPSDSTSHSVSSWNYGYWIGGAHSSTAERLDFSNDTSPFVSRMQLLASKLSPSNSNYLNQSVASPSTAYLWLGQQTSPFIVQAFEFANDTVNLQPGLSPASFSSSATTVYNANYGYISNSRNISRIDFSNDTGSLTPVQSNTLHSPGTDLGATGNTSYSWWGGGNPSTVSSVSRMDYSSDTTALAPKGPLAVGRGNFGGATGNADYGWFQGGGPGFTSGRTNVDRIDYSNDTATASPRGQLQQQAASQSGDSCGNSNSSWMKNYFNNNAVQKIQYSNDTVTSTEAQSSPNAYWSTSLSIVQYGLPQVPVKVIGFAPTPYGIPFGYFGGGSTGSAFVSTVDRIDYSNDTATAAAKGPLTGIRYALAAASNSFFGYFAGGRPTPSTITTTTDRIDYTNDTATATPKGPLGTPGGPRYSLAATGNTSASYFAGGASTSQIKSSVERIQYGNDTADMTFKGPLTSARYQLMGIGNKNFGYFAGGKPAPEKTTVDRIDYSNDSPTAVAKGPLSQTRGQAGTAGNGDFGYIAGGDGGSGAISTIDRIDYANDTNTATPKGLLSRNIRLLGGTGSADVGYFGGGYDGSSPVSTVDRIDFSNDTVTASPKGPLSQIRNNLAAASSLDHGLPNVGVPVPRKFNFATGVREPVNSGYTTGNGQNMHRYDYTNDTMSLLGATSVLSLSISGGRPHTASSSTHGYWSGGNSPSVSSAVARLDYAAEDINLVLRASTPSTRYMGASSYNLSYAWWSGGFAPSRSSTVTRLDYANDNTAPAPKGPLSASTYRHAATGNQNYGYHAGGDIPTTTSKVERIDYGNDTATATPKGPLSAAKRYLASSSNADYGYFAGGAPGDQTTVDRIDFANDTATALVRTSLRRPSPVSYNLSGFGSSDAAHFSGGQSTSSEIERLDYANETLSTISTGINLNYQKAVSARQNGVPVPTQTLRSFANSTVQAYPRNFIGYFGGGDSPGSDTNEIHKFNIFNDNITPNVSQLSTPRGASGATGNTNFGYWLGGSTSKTFTDRLDYSNDTSSTLSRGPVSNTVDGAATGNADFAYFVANSYSQTERLDFSNDTAAIAPKGHLLRRRYQANSQFTGNQSFGYYAGGSDVENPNTYTSLTDRLDYSNDTATALARGTLAAAKNNAAASANASFGYWTGGQNPSIVGRSTSIDRLDFSNDTTNMLHKGAIAVGPSPLDNSGRGSDGGTGNGSFGFFGGGGPSARGIAVLDYANDTSATRSTLNGMPRKENIAGVSAAEKGLFPDTFGTLSPTTATNFGYFISGPSTGILRIDYSNDSETGRSGAANPNVGSMGVVGASSQTYGYLAGGKPAANLPSGNSNNGPYHAIFRFDYQNDLYGLVLRSQLYAGNYGSPGPGASVYNTTHGYWAGGWNLSGPLAPSMDSSAVNRLDFANDTNDAIIRGSLAVGQESTSASGNASSGWFIGGDNPAGNSVIQRMDYSSDTTWTIKSPLPANRSYHSSTGNASYAWIGGGFSPSTTSSVTRLDYGNDTSSPAPKGPLSRAFYNVSATGNTSFGYFTGGSPAAGSLVDRIDYSNDTATASPKGPLGGSMLTGSNNFGFSAAANALPQ